MELGVRSVRQVGPRGRFPVSPSWWPGGRREVRSDVRDAQPAAWLEVTEVADGLGYESVWLPEHLVLPVEMGGSRTRIRPSADPAEHAGVRRLRPTWRSSPGARRTDPARHPRLQHRAAASVHRRPGRRDPGRRLGGSGRVRRRCELDARGVGRLGSTSRTRGRRVDEAIDVCRRCGPTRWSSTTASSSTSTPVMFEPKPVQQPHPPVLIGGDVPAALRRAGERWGRAGCR